MSESLEQPQVHAHTPRSQGRIRCQTGECESALFENARIHRFTRQFIQSDTQGGKRS